MYLAFPTYVLKQSMFEASEALQREKINENNVVPSLVMKF